MLAILSGPWALAMLIPRRSFSTPLVVIWRGDQGSKIVLVRSYLRVSQAAGQVNILIILLKIKFSPCMPINLLMQGKCLFSDISRPGDIGRLALFLVSGSSWSWSRVKTDWNCSTSS